MAVDNEKLGTQVVSENYFDVDKMATSAGNIAGLFTIFGQSMQEIDQIMDEYVPGKYIKAPSLAKYINDAWHGMALSQMGQFQLMFDEWNGLISAAYAENSNFSEEAEAEFAKLLEFNFESDASAGGARASQSKTEGTAEDKAVFTYSVMRDISKITGRSDVSYDEYKKAYDSMSDEAKKYVDKTNQEDADYLIRVYGSDVLEDSERFNKITSGYNADVVQIIEDKLGGVDIC